MNYIYSENHVKEIIKSYESGLTCANIAETYNVWPDIIRNILKKNGVQLRVRGNKKGSNPWNKGKTFNKEEASVKLVESGSFKHLSEGAIRKHV